MNPDEPVRWVEGTTLYSRGPELAVQIRGPLDFIGRLEFDIAGLADVDTFLFGDTASVTRSAMDERSEICLAPRSSSFRICGLPGSAAPQSANTDSKEAQAAGLPSGVLVSPADLVSVLRLCGLTRCRLLSPKAGSLASSHRLSRAAVTEVSSISRSHGRNMRPLAQPDCRCESCLDTVPHACVGFVHP